MKNTDKLLFASVILIFVIVCICTILIKISSQLPDTPIEEVDVGAPVEEVTDRNNYYMIQNSVRAFYKYYAQMYEDTKNKQDNYEVLYNMLDEKYIAFNKITKEDVGTHLPEIKTSVVNITKMYVSKQNETISVYIVEGTLREEVSNKISNFKIMVQVDLQNETFSIILQDYIKAKYPDLNLDSNLKMESLNNIQKNKDNTYVWEEISDQTYVMDLVNKYKEEALYNLDLAYKRINEEYKAIKFKTIDSYKKSVENNTILKNEIELVKYSAKDVDGYKQYVCVDKNGCYYIFKEKNIMEYTIILDTYTIDLPEFIEKYESANTVKRAGYNIQKCLDAINNKDYEYVYDKLDEEFKKNNYPTLESFETTIKSKLFTNNVVKTVKSFNEGIIYIYKVTITDENDTTKEQPMTFIVQLKEGTDFVMSLSFEI